MAKLIQEAFRLQTLAGLRPINELEEDKAKKDFDGDGEIESPEEEYKGSVDKKIKQSQGKDVDECWDEEDSMVMVGAPSQEPDQMDFTHGEDHEGSMAHSEIRSLISNASRLEQLLKGNPELPGWVSAYITLASDYMNSVADYMVDKADTNHHED